MSTDKVNVVVVGGGVIGCSTAYYLARAGARVTLLERGPLCSEASSANAGSTTVSTREGLMLALARESQRLIVQASQELETDFEFARVGSLTLLRTEEELLEQRAFVEKQRQNGVEIEFLDRKTTLEMEPAVSPDILGGVYSPVDAALSPYALTLAFGRGARRLGAAIRTGTEVTTLKTEGRRVRAAITPEGEVAGDVIVVAAGAWSPVLTRTIGLDLPIEPSRGQIVVTEPLPPLIRCTIKSTHHIYVRPTRRGNHVIGSISERVGFNKRLTPDRLNAYVKEGAHLVPSLNNVRVLRAWSGLRPLTADGQPILGEIEGYEGLIVAAGHSRTGVTFSASTSKMVADLITTGSAGYPLEPFSARRFTAA